MCSILFQAFLKRHLVRNTSRLKSNVSSLNLGSLQGWHIDVQLVNHTNGMINLVTTNDGVRHLWRDVSGTAAMPLGFHLHKINSRSPCFAGVGNSVNMHNFASLGRPNPSKYPKRNHIIL